MLNEPQKIIENDETYSTWFGNIQGDFDCNYTVNEKDTNLKQSKNSKIENTGLQKNDSTSLPKKISYLPQSLPKPNWTQANDKIEKNVMPQPKAGLYANMQVKSLLKKRPVVKGNTGNKPNISFDEKLSKKDAIKL